MTIATKNGVPIVKDGVVASNCGCCESSVLCKSIENVADAITVSLESENFRGAVQWSGPSVPTGVTITTAHFGEYTNGDFVLTLRTANGYLAWWSDPISTPFYTNVAFEPRVGFFPKGSVLGDIPVLVVPYLFFSERENGLTTGRGLDFFLNKHATWAGAGQPNIIQTFSTAVTGGCPNGIPVIGLYNGQPQQNGGIGYEQVNVPPAGSPKGRIAWGANVLRVNSQVGLPFRQCIPWIATRPEIFSLFPNTTVGVLLGTGLLNSGASFSDGDHNLWLTGIEESPLP